jgi:hypothetical protein
MNIITESINKEEIDITINSTNKEIIKNLNDCCTSVRTIFTNAFGYGYAQAYNQCPIDMIEKIIALNGDDNGLNYCNLLKENIRIFKIDESHLQTCGFIGKMMMSSADYYSFSNDPKNKHGIKNMIYLLNNKKCDTIGSDRSNPTKWIIPDTYFSPLIKFLNSESSKDPNIGVLNKEVIKYYNKLRSNVV